MNENQNQTLFPYEWLVVILFCLILLTLSIFALKASGGNLSTERYPQGGEKLKEIAVKVNGAVAKPGVYQLPEKATVKELLGRAELLSTADQSRISMRKRLVNGQTITIAFRRPIVVYISGAVKYPGEMEILSGTRYSELVEQVELDGRADLAALKRKKSFVSEGAKITVPFRKKGDGSTAFSRLSHAKKRVGS